VRSRLGAATVEKRRSTTTVTLDALSPPTRWTPGCHRDGRPAELLRAVRSDPDFGVRVGALGALRHMGPRARRAVPLLRRLLRILTGPFKGSQRRRWGQCRARGLADHRARQGALPSGEPRPAPLGGATGGDDPDLIRRGHDLKVQVAPGLRQQAAPDDPAGLGGEHGIRPGRSAMPARAASSSSSNRSGAFDRFARHHCLRTRICAAASGATTSFIRTCARA